MKILTSIIIIFFLLISGNCALAESNNLTTYEVPDQIELSSGDISRIDIFVHDINDNPIREATIILKSLEEPVSQDKNLFTNREGRAIAQVNPGTYGFSIQARNYQNVSKTITIFNRGPETIEFTLVPETGYDLWIFFLPIFLGFLLYVCWLCESSEKMKFAFIVFLLSIFIPFLILMSDLHYTMFFYISLFLFLFLLITFILISLYFTKKPEIPQKRTDFSNIIAETFELVKTFLTVLAILSWALIVCYFECENIETVVISDLNYLEFPVYIVVGVTIGVLSYLMLTIRQSFSQLLPAHEMRNILWECTRRILIAPYIAVVGVYLLFSISTNDITNSFVNFSNSTPNIAGPSGIDIATSNAHFVFLFSIFAGMFTNTVEESVYKNVRKFLSLNAGKEDEDNNGGIKESDLFKLGIKNEDLIYRLYYEANIKTTQSLAKADAQDTSKKLRSNYPKGEIQYYIDLAKASLENKNSGESKPEDAGSDPET